MKVELLAAEGLVRNIAALSGSTIQSQADISARRRSSRRGWVALLKRHEALLLALTTAALLVPVWAFTYLPTTDGAAHVANADVMRRMGEPGLGVLGQYYYVNHSPIPNLVGHMALAGLLYFLPIVVAEKVLVSLYMVLLPLAVRYAMRSMRAKATPLAFLALPLVYNYLFAQGFYNFCLSIAVYFFVVGYWIRNRDRLGVWRGGMLLVLALLLYTCHLFSLMMACGTLGLLTVWFSWQEIRRGVYKPAGRRAAVTLVAMLPGLIMAWQFRPAAPVVKHDAAEVSSVAEDLLGLLQFNSMTSYRTGEAWLGAAVASVLAALGLMALLGKIVRGSWTRWDALLILPAGLTAVYFKAHDTVSLHFYIPHRVMLYLFLTLLLWLAGQPMSRRVRWGIVPVGIVLALAFAVSHGLKYREFAPQLAEFVAAGDQIRPNSTFLPLIFSTRGRTFSGAVSSVDVQPFYQAGGYIAARRKAVDLKNYEANTDHFPVRFLPKVNPYKYLAAGADGFDRVPPRIDIEGFRKAGGEVDYVLIWGLENSFRTHADTEAIYRQLEAGYEQVDLPNAPRWTELWKRRAD